MIRLFLIRHGATAGNLARRYVGRTDEPLCREGIAQMEALKQQGLRPDCLFVSPMLRARQSAQILFPGMACTVVDDFRESDFGAFEGKTADELSEDPDYRRWVDTLCQGPIPGGERMADLKRRCVAAFRALLPSIPDGSTAALVVHGGTIMALMEVCAPQAGDFYAFHIPNGQYVAVTCCKEDLCT